MTILCISNIVNKFNRGNEIDQTQNLIELILRLLCLVMTLSCNKDKKNMIIKKFAK